VKVANVNRQAEGQKFNKQVAAASASIAAVAASSPAFAVVEYVPATEGTSLPFGIDDPLLFWLGIGTFGAVWGFWLTGVQGLGNRDGEESSY